MMKLLRKCQITIKIKISNLIFHRRLCKSPFYENKISDGVNFVSYSNGGTISASIDNLKSK